MWYHGYGLSLSGSAKGETGVIQPSRVALGTTAHSRHNFTAHWPQALAIKQRLTFNNHTDTSLAYRSQVRWIAAFVPSLNALGERLMAMRAPPAG